MKTALCEEEGVHYRIAGKHYDKTPTTPPHAVVTELSPNEAATGGRGALGGRMAGL